MSLGFDIGQGAGLAGATGVRPFLPPILTGALASGDVGVDFDNTDFSWVESPVFLLVVLALAVIAYAMDRRARSVVPSGSGNGTGRPERSPMQAALAVVAMALGAVVFGASLAEGGRTEWPGVIAGMICAFLGFMAVALLFARARSRLEGGAAALLNAYADVTSLVLAAVTILFPPLGYAIIVGFVVLLVRAARGGTQKYEGLRVLR
jgi:cytochrome bd-type quinol oxidase subunit 2